MYIHKKWELPLLLFFFFFSSSLPVWFELVFCFLFYIFKDLYMFTLYLQYKIIWYQHLPIFMCLQSIIKRPNRLMNSNFGLVSCHFFFPSSLVWTYFCFIILLRIFICLFCTCNISLYCIHTKSDKYYIHLKKKW